MSTKRRKLEADLFGQEMEFEYSGHWISYAIIGLRIVMGRTLFQDWITKLVAYLGWNSSLDCICCSDVLKRRRGNASDERRGFH